MSNVESAGLPIYTSMVECEAATGIPRDVLKAAKSEGCPAFLSSGRVALGPFLRWYFDKERISRGDTAEARLNYQQERAARERAQRMLLEQQYRLREEQYIRFDVVVKWLGDVIVRPLGTFLMAMPTAWGRIVNPDKPDVGRDGLQKLADTMRELLAAVMSTKPAGTEEMEKENDEEPDQEIDGDTEAVDEETA